MTKSYAQLTKQIESLQAQANKIRVAEIKGVISRINDAIKAYGITSEDLAFIPPKAPIVGKPNAAKGQSAKASGKRYADGSGNVWGGRGPMPKWLRAEINSGKRLADFAADGTAAPASVATPKLAKTKVKLEAKYRDVATGSIWTGRGSKPRWLRAALDAGKKIEDFLVGAASAVSGAASSATESVEASSSGKKPSLTTKKGAATKGAKVAKTPKSKAQQSKAVPTVRKAATLKPPIGALTGFPIQD